MLLVITLAFRRSVTELRRRGTEAFGVGLVWGRNDRAGAPRTARQRFGVRAALRRFGRAV